jgi:hypothetical protein
MRLLEILILIVDLLAITRALALMRPPRRWVEAVPFVAGVLVVLHVLLEGYRWQMIPAYALTAVLCLIGVVRWVRPARRLDRRAAGRVSGSSPACAGRVVCPRHGHV